MVAYFDIAPRDFKGLILWTNWSQFWFPLNPPTLTPPLTVPKLRIPQLPDFHLALQRFFRTLDFPVMQIVGCKVRGCVSCCELE